MSEQYCPFPDYFPNTQSIIIQKEIKTHTFSTMKNCLQAINTYHNKAVMLKLPGTQKKTEGKTNKHLKLN